MADGLSTDAQAFSKLIKPVTARVEALEQRLGRIEEALASLALTFAKPSRPTPNNLGGPFPEAAVSSVPQKRPLGSGSELPDAEPVSLRPYQYHALDASRNEIRVLSLTRSRQQTDRIRGNLLHVSLDDVVGNAASSPFQATPLFGRAQPIFGQARSTNRYKALSYTWGDPTSEGRSSSILIAGASLQVTENLDHALRQLQDEIGSTEQTSNWWIDAICINQEDVEERNSQVALMRRIYGSALQVKVWLGDEYDESTEAISLVKKLAHPPPRGPAHPKTAYPDIPDGTKLKNLACVSSLFRRPWWDRVWVRQEVALGYDLSFVCGDASCTLEELTAAERALEDSLLRLRADLEQEDVAHTLKMIQTRQAGRAEGLQELRNKSRKGDNYVDLCTLLFHARGCKASDLRDKVFGVLGLADPGVYELAVDYRLPVRDVFLKAAIAIISKTNKLDILSAAQNVDRVHSLPSWAPNLMDPWKAQPFPKQMFPLVPLVSYSQAQANASWQINASGKVLTVKGRIYGYIQRLSDQVARSTHSSHELYQVFCKWKDFTASTWRAEPKVGLFGDYAAFGSDYEGFESAEERHLAQLLLVTSQQQKALWTFGTQTQPDVTYSRSLLAPDTWIEGRISNLSIQDGMRRYGVGRRVGQCRSGKVGLVPEDAREGDIIVCLYGADNPYVLRKQKGGCLLVGDASFTAILGTELKGNDEDFQLY